MTVRELKAMLPLFFDALPEFRSSAFLTSNFIDPTTLSLIFDSAPLSDDTRMCVVSASRPLTLSVASSTNCEPLRAPPTIPHDFLEILEKLRDATSLALMLNTQDRRIAMERLQDASRSKYMLDPHKVYTTANVDAAWSPAWLSHTINTVRVDDLSIKRFPGGVTLAGVNVGTGFVVDLGGMPPELCGRVVMTCSHCVCFDGITPAFGRYIRGKFLAADCPSGFWDATRTYASATPGLAREQCPLVDSLRSHMAAPHKVVRIYMPSQELFADVAILILENAIPGVAGERIFANLWVPPADGPLLIGGGAFIVGYGVTGHRQKQNVAAFGAIADVIKYGALEARARLSDALGRNTKKLIDISGDASFGDDNDLNIRGIGANIGSDLPTAGAGNSGALVIWRSNTEGEDDKFIGIYSGSAFCNSPLFPGVEQKALQMVQELVEFAVASERERFPAH
jgi:hypothetical protein